MLFSLTLNNIQTQTQDEKYDNQFLYLLMRTLGDLLSCRSLFNEFHFMVLLKALNSTISSLFLKIFTRLIYLVSCQLATPMCQSVNYSLSPLRPRSLTNPRGPKGQFLLISSLLNVGALFRVCGLRSKIC